MIKIISRFLIILLCILLVTPVPASAAPKSGTIPTFSVVGVVIDTSVTITTYNFPANDNFDVLMGAMGSRGVNGIKVGTMTTGTGGSFSRTFSIPAPLHGRYQIAIRLQSNTGSGYYAYNWFYNNTSGTSSGSPSGIVYSGIPTFSIVSVDKDKTVTIQTQNFPKNDSFNVLMNYMGTRGVNGIKVDTVSTGNGGQLTYTFDIPNALKGLYQISIRLQSNTGSGYYAYNWFYNNTSGTGGLIPGYFGYPTFSIASVARDTSVTISTNNLPPGEKFNVLMGPMGTRGINGVLVTTIDTGAGGSQILTFNIPGVLHGSYQIAIRIQSISGSGLYAYNWFYNNTTP